MAWTPIVKLNTHIPLLQVKSAKRFMEKFLQQHYNKVQISRQLPQISMPSNQKNQTCKICNTKSKIAQMQHFVMSPINKNHIHIVKQKALSYYVELQRSFWFNDWFEGYSLVKTQSDKVGKSLWSMINSSPAEQQWRSLHDL